MLKTAHQALTRQESSTTHAQHAQVELLALHGTNINANCGLIASAVSTLLPTAQALPTASVTIAVMENIPPLPMRIHACIGGIVRQANTF